jgi:thiol-disulfide isomerase/thioredoxin
MKMTCLSRSLSPRRSTLFAALFSLLLLGCQDGASAGNGGAMGSQPEFKLKTLDGRKLGPADFKGQVVVVDFWATWCGPCHIQARILEPIHEDYKGKGVQFLAANVGEDEATVRGFVKDKPFPYPVLLDAESTVSGKLGVVALPTLMVIDKKGKVSFLQAGVVDGPSLRRVLKEAGIV